MKKAWLFIKKNFRYGISSVLLAIVFGILFSLFWRTLITEAKYASAVTAFSTLALAFVTALLALFTFSNIVSANNREKSYRKERILNEVTDWVINISKTNLKFEITKFESLNIEYLARNSFPELVNELQESWERSKYIEGVVEIFDSSLIKAVGSLKNNLETQTEQVNGTVIGFKLGGEKRKIGNIDFDSTTCFELIQRNRIKLQKYINAVLKEVSISKLKLLNP